MNLYIDEAKNLRAQLHSCPEASMAEVKTKKTLINYLEENTNLQISDEGNWFYAKYCAQPSGTQTKTICFRADYDAVTDADGISRHLCGHDGHAAVLAAFGKWVSNNEPAKNIIFLFQPGEESGEGALVCRDIFSHEHIDEIYAFHNIPGYSTGSLLLRNGTFACASTGLELAFHGATAHAAYPENGRNPAIAISELILAVNQYVHEPHDGMLLSTVIGIQLGSSSYGVSASEGVLRLTVRAEYNKEFTKFLAFIHEHATTLAKKHALSVDIKEIERFPSTENWFSDEYPFAEKLEGIANKNSIDCHYLSDPFRWSEDFGWYLQETPGMIFGIGSGEDCPPLHDADYEFNDEIFENVLRIYRGIIGN